MTKSTNKYRFEFASASDIGKQRSENQDRCDWFETSQPGSYIIIVADGMGGHAGGRIAAEIAIQSVKTTFTLPFSDPRKQILKSFELAAHRLSDKADSDSTLYNMGCTLSLALYYKKQVHSAHIGDSRIYRITNSNIDQLSEDHSLVQEMVKQGAIKPENVRAHRKGNVLLRALTSNSDCELDIYEPVKVSSDEVFLVCSDGLWNMIQDREIQDIVIRNNVEDAVKVLIRRANELGGKDNIAASIMRIF